MKSTVVTTFFSLATTAESVLQKFRKTFSLRFQKKGSKETSSTDIGEVLPEGLPVTCDIDSPLHLPSVTASAGIHVDAKEEPPEQKYK